MERRQFLQMTGGMALVTALSAAGSRSFAAEEEAGLFRAWLPDGRPLAERALNQLYFLDLQDEPLPNPSRRLEAGSLWSEQPSVIPFAVALRLPVEGFGEVTLYADNQGLGYQPTDDPLNLNLAFARTRLYRVTQALQTWSEAGFVFSRGIQDRLEKARAALQKAESAEDETAMAGWCNESLVESLWAGEEAAFARAQQRIQAQQSRSDFLWGCNLFNYPQGGSEYERRFRELFNFATIPLYWKNFEPEPRKPNYAQADEPVKWLNQANITPKGHPLVWFHDVGIPEWLRDKPYRVVVDHVQRRVREITARYQGRMPYYDIINEANGLRSANQLGYSPEQLIELARLSAQAAKAGYSGVNRIINSCCLWAENVAYDVTLPQQRSPFQYVKACLEAEIPFETIGLQLYYPQQDMFEIDRLLDRFSQLGKPIHVTELGVSSATGIDEDSYLKEARGLWHAPWSETVQADWVEQFYTLCYSKPEVSAVTWWDFNDRAGVFWPFGGLLDDKMQPKEAFYRLRSLIARWRGELS